MEEKLTIEQIVKAMQALPGSIEDTSLDMCYPIGEQIYNFLQSMVALESEMTTKEYFDGWRDMAAQFLDALHKAA